MKVFLIFQCFWFAGWLCHVHAFEAQHAASDTIVLARQLNPTDWDTTTLAVSSPGLWKMLADETTNLVTCLPDSSLVLRLAFVFDPESTSLGMLGIAAIRKHPHPPQRQEWAPGKYMMLDLSLDQILHQELVEYREWDVVTIPDGTIQKIRGVILAQHHYVYRRHHDEPIMLYVFVFAGRNWMSR